MSERVSQVPQYPFADTLTEQEAQLAENPLMRRFAESREKLSADRYRPAYHFVSPESSLNDPNGLCFWQGRWHLFYQGYPPEDPRQHWGHAVSDDLIHWRDLPYAIYPDPEECCFSGAALVEDDRVIAMYHGTKVGNMIATSSDPLLLNWEKLTGGPVIPIASKDGSLLPYRVFDPCIWKKGEFYYALSGGTVPFTDDGRHTAADFLFRSKNLTDWEYLHPFVKNDRFTMVGDDGACPYFWPIGDKHILLFFSHMSGGQYILGDYDTGRDELVATSAAKFNMGTWGPSGVHAPSAAPDGDDVIVIFNMNAGYNTPGWNQIMSLPRRLSLRTPTQLGQEPAGDVESLRADHRSVARRALPMNEEIILDGVAGDTIEIVTEIDTGKAEIVELCILRSLDGEEYTRIAFYPDYGLRRDGMWDGCRNGVISLDMSRTSTAPGAKARPAESAQVPLDEGETLRLRVFVDRSIVEVFVNGKQCVATRVYPGREDSKGVSLSARGGEAKLLSLDAWRMESIW